jgi:hypothetical protein
MVAIATVAPSGYQNATAQITAVPTAYTFTYANTTTGAVTTAGTVTPNAYMVITAPAHGFAKGDVVTTTSATDSNFNVSAQTIRWIPTYVGPTGTNVASTDLFVLDSSAGKIDSKEDTTGIAVAVSSSAKKKALTSISYPDVNTIVFGATAHSYAVGDYVTIRGISTSGYTGLNNGTTTSNQVTAVTANSFTVTKTAHGVTPAAGTVDVSSTGATGASGVITYKSTKNPGVGATVSVTGLSFDIATQTPILNAPGALTFTTTQVHGLAVGNSITIATVDASSASTSTLYQGTFTVLAVPSTTTFTISKSTFLSAYPVTTAGTVSTAAGTGLNVTNATVVTSSGTQFTVASPVVAVSNTATNGSVAISGVLDTTGTSYGAVKTGTVKTQSIAKNANTTAITATPTITVFN